VLSGLEVVLGVTALLAGATGTWSPCGFSMVETLGGHGHSRATAVTACVTFAVGALVGGVVTFGGLALLGDAVHGAGPAIGLAVAALVAAAAALGEIAGVRVLPQIRRQVPEPWRRVLPMPLAAGLYGVLLGLGFTTFVLTLAVWALAGISVAVGDVQLGLVVGLAFGVGRALPVVVIAPAMGTRFAESALDAMAERPLILRGLRLADGLALGVCALVLGTSVAEAATTERVAPSATDPTSAGSDVAWQVPGATGVLLRRGEERPLPGTHPALGGKIAAWRNGDVITVARRSSLRPLFSRTIPGLTKIAVSSRWVAVRSTRPDGGDEIGVFRISRPSSRRIVASVAPPHELGRPAIAGNRVVFHRAGPESSAIFSADMRGGDPDRLARSRKVQLLHPSMRSGGLVYVALDRCGQKLRLADTDGDNPRTLVRLAPLARRDRGHEHGHTRQGRRATTCSHGRLGPSTHMLWTAAAGTTDVLFTRIARATGVPEIVRVSRR
jgi:hypothetical protein